MNFLHLYLVSLVIIAGLCDAFSLLDNPLKMLNKCISDHECKSHEFCDHTGINPFGTCHVGKEANRSCMFDRHCASKQCHHLKYINK